MTGTSVRREANEDGEAEQSGLLKFYKTATLQQAHQIGFATGFPQRRDYIYAVCCCYGALVATHRVTA